MEFLRERNLLRVTVVAIFALVLAVILTRLLRRRPGRRELALLALLGLVYLGVLASTERAEERIHFLQYGVLGGLIYEALLERRRRLSPQRFSSAVASPWRWPGPSAVLLTSLCGWGDEGIQAILPNRFYDLRDVGLNIAGGLLAVVSMALLTRARQRDGEASVRPGAASDPPDRRRR